MKISINVGQSIQGAINGATNGDIVHLHEGTFDITSGHIVMKSGVVLEGEGPDKTIIKGSSSAGGIAGSDTNDGIIYCNDIDNFEIRNMGFASDAKGISDGGHGNGRTSIYINESSNGKISNCKVFKYIYSDFIKCRSSTGITVGNCTGQTGHDFVQFLKSKNCKASNLDITIQTNCGIRFDGSHDCELCNCNITGVQGTGWCMVELENDVANLNIHHNVFHDYRGSSGNAVTQPVHASASNVQVHDNVIWNCGEIRMGTASNNIVNPSDRNLTSWNRQGYGCTSTKVDVVTPVNANTNTNTNTPDPETPIKVDFNVSVNTGKAPFKMMFVDVSEGAKVTSWLWDFGDGITSKHAQTATHTFTKAGTYDVSLTVNGTYKLVKPEFIVVMKDDEGPVVVGPISVVKPVVERTRVYVATDGSGQFNCDGVDDQIEISAAIKYADANGIQDVYMKAGKYFISDHITFGKCRLTGDKGANGALIFNAGRSPEDMPYI